MTAQFDDALSTAALNETERRAVAHRRGVRSRVGRAQHAQVAREGGDYSAVTPSEQEAERYVQGAADFLAAVEQMLGDEKQGD